MNTKPEVSLRVKGRNVDTDTFSTLLNIIGRDAMVNFVVLLAGLRVHVPKDRRRTTGSSRLCTVIGQEAFYKLIDSQVFAGEIIEVSKNTYWCAAELRKDGLSSIDIAIALRLTQDTAGKILRALGLGGKGEFRDNRLGRMRQRVARGLP